VPPRPSEDEIFLLFGYNHQACEFSESLSSRFSQELGQQKRQPFVHEEGTFAAMHRDGEHG